MGDAYIPIPYMRLPPILWFLLLDGLTPQSHSQFDARDAPREAMKLVVLVLLLDLATSVALVSSDMLLHCRATDSVPRTVAAKWRRRVAGPRGSAVRAERCRERSPPKGGAPRPRWLQHAWKLEGLQRWLSRRLRTCDCAHYITITYL